jgi:hypothetical protein
VIAPAAMPGLGFLPPPTEVILAVQVPRLMEAIGSEGQSDAAFQLRQLGVPETVMELVEKASGVGLENVDQIVVGLGFEQSAFPPQVTVVVHTRQPFDMQAIARDAKANRLKRGARTLYVARINPVFEFYWWAPTDRILVATLNARDYDAIEFKPRTGIEHLRTGMARLIRDEVAAGSCLWLAANSDRWDDRIRPYVILPLTPLQGRTDLLAPASRLQSVTISIRHDPNRPADVQLRLKSADAGEELRTVLAERFRGEPVEVTGEEELCRLTAPFDPRQFGSLIGRLIPPKN